MRRRGLIARASIAALAGSLAAGIAEAQPSRGHHNPTPETHAPAPANASTDPTDLRARFGVERARTLLHSPDGGERLRGVERAAALGTRDAIALLVEQLDLSAATRNDARAKMAIARGLAQHTDQLAARAALIQLLDLPTPKPSAQKPETLDPLYAPRLEVARGIAALGLATSGEPHAVEALVAAARGTGAGAAAATAALTAYPPASSATWARPMSAAVARLVARLGDLRALGTVLDAANETTLADAPARAAAIEALGALGDTRVIAIAKGVLGDDDPRLRAAAATALVTLGAPDAAHAVEQLLGDDATAAKGIALALAAHGPGVVHALAARAAIAADRAVRSAAVVALGRDPTAEGTEALSALSADPLLRADAADAIARSPSPASMGAIERLAASPATRRLAARAYVVRVVTRDEKSGAMERALADLARAADERDRSVGVAAQVVLGETDAVRWLDDPSPLVRRAVATAASGRVGAEPRLEDALLARRAREDDPVTAAVLGAGLLGGDPSARIPTHALVACARAGRADAPLCTLALLRRGTQDSAGSDAAAGELEALLAAADPIVRAHAARGIAGSTDPTRGGRLAAVYAYEPDPLVRRAIFAGLDALPLDAPSLADTVAVGARLDPDPEVRWVAARLADPHAPKRAGGDHEETAIAWVHLVEASGAAPPAGATGALLRADGLAVPVAFDADGDALVPGVPPGSTRLVLAPRLDAAYGDAR